MTHGNLSSPNTTFTLFHLVYITECQWPHFKSWLNPCGQTEGERQREIKKAYKNEAGLKFTMWSVACQNLMA